MAVLLATAIDDRIGYIFVLTEKSPPRLPGNGAKKDTSMRVAFWGAELKPNPDKGIK